MYIARTEDNRFVFFTDETEIPENYTPICLAPEHITKLAEQLLSEDKTGEISDLTAAKLRTALEDFMLEYDKQNCEPSFVLKASDSVAITVLQCWCDERTAEIDRGSRPDTPEERNAIAQMIDRIAEYRRWQKAHIT